MVLVVLGAFLGASFTFLFSVFLENRNQRNIGKDARNIISSELGIIAENLKRIQSLKEVDAWGSILYNKIIIQNSWSKYRSVFLEFATKEQIKTIDNAYGTAELDRIMELAIEVEILRGRDASHLKSLYYGLQQDMHEFIKEIEDVAKEIT